jgi:hypothetical protein
VFLIGLDIVKNVAVAVQAMCALRFFFHGLVKRQSNLCIIWLDHSERPSFDRTDLVIDRSDHGIVKFSYPLCTNSGFCSHFVLAGVENTEALLGFPNGC